MHTVSPTTRTDTRTMTPPQFPTMPLIAYGRVSTQTQCGDGALDVQKQKMHDFAVTLGVTILTTYVECASAAEVGNAAKRSQLLAAIDRCRHAVSKGLPIGLLVSDIKRLDRDPETDLGKLLKDIPVYSVADGGLVELDALLRKIRGASADIMNIRSGTHAGLNAAKQAGKTLGSPGDQRAAAEASTEVRRRNRDRTTDDLTRFFRQNPGTEDLPLEALARRLNAEGRLNSVGKPWNTTNIRIRRREAIRSLTVPSYTEEELALLEQIEWGS